MRPPFPFPPKPSQHGVAPGLALWGECFDAWDKVRRERDAAEARVGVLALGAFLGWAVAAGALGALLFG